MTKQNNKIYISDLDGTLLKDNATLSDYSRNKLIELIEAGVNFTIASARSIAELKPILHDIPFKLPIIEINGSFITDFHTTEHIIINEMKKDVIEDVFNRAVSHKCMPFLSAFDGATDRLYYNNILNPGMEWYLQDRITHKDYRLTKVSDLIDTFDTHIVAFAIMDSYENLVDLSKEMTADYGSSLQMHFFENPYSRPWHWLTIHNQKACKSHAVKELLDYTKFDHEHLTVFGDNLNDVNMFKMAATSVAVENATNQIKGHATTIIGTNEQDSVVKYIAQKELGI